MGMLPSRVGATNGLGFWVGFLPSIAPRALSYVSASPFFAKGS